MSPLQDDSLLKGRMIAGAGAVLDDYQGSWLMLSRLAADLCLCRWLLWLVALHGSAGNCRQLWKSGALTGTSPTSQHKLACSHTLA
jgi:hypothetical protein